MKKLTAVLSILAVALVGPSVGPSSVFAAEPVATSNASVLAINTFSKSLSPKGKSGYYEMYEFYVFQNGTVTVNLTQNSTGGAKGTYRILEYYGPDQWLGTGNYFDSNGNGSFSFTTTPLQPGRYGIRLANDGPNEMKVNGTITTP
ncbi:hypothetical protein [Brevibacillus sp. SIMBA_040]|uniref:hypothetical protein n=1 Tax=unclassified Brevibacillus TaxID=2684853 RepID=UPI00397D2693